MTQNEGISEKKNAGQEPITPEGKTEQAAESGKAPETEESEAIKHPWEEELKTYPLRTPEEDPGWVVKIVKVWLGFALASGLFILLLLVLGLFYD